MKKIKCAKQVMGNNPISSATPKQLRAIEKCNILAAGGKPNSKVFGKNTVFNTKVDSTKTMIRDLSSPLSPSKF